MGLVNPITVSLDHAQSRISEAPITVVSQGSYRGLQNRRLSGYDPTYQSNVYVDPVTFTLMLAPAPTLAAWHTTGTGIYARLSKTDFTFSNSAKWKDHEINQASGGDTWLKGDGLSSDTAITTATYTKNRPMWISWLNNANAGDDYLVMSCGWNSSASDASGVSLKFYASGRCDVYKDGGKVGEGKITGGKAKAANDGQYIGVMLIPCRQRELLIVSINGDGFSHAFRDLSETATDNTITGATNFWFEPGVATDGSATVQVAPIQFPASGYACGLLSYFAEPPATGIGAATTGYYGWLPGYGTQTVSVSLVEESDGSTAFVPNGTKAAAYVRTDLTGDGISTAFVYGGVAGWGSAFDSTNSAEETAVEDYVSSHQLGVSEDGRASYSMTIRNVSGVEGTGITGIKTQSNRPVDVQVGGYTLLDGRTDPPRWTDGPNEAAQNLVIEAKDQWKDLENFRFRDAYPLDGLDLLGVLEWLVELAVPAAQIDIEDPAITLPIKPAGVCGEWNLQIETGDTPADWIDRLFENFAGDWIYGFVPTTTGVKFKARSPSGVDTAPVVELFKDSGDAYDYYIGLGETDADAREVYRLGTIRSWEESRVEPEANEIRVTGWAAEINRPIQAFYRDDASADATTAPNARPDNWIGQERLYGLLDPALTTQELCEDAAKLLARRLTTQRRMAEFECEFLTIPSSGLPVWRGDVILIDGEYWRVTSFSVDFGPGAGGKEPGATETGRDRWFWRDARYTVEYLGSVQPVDPWWKSHLPNTIGMAALIRAQQEAGAFRQVVRRGGEWLALLTSSKTTRVTTLT